MKIDVPIITSHISIDELLGWVKKSTQTIRFGKVGVEFHIQDGVITSYEPIYRPHIKPQQILVDGERPDGCLSSDKPLKRTRLAPMKPKSPKIQYVTEGQDPQKVK